MSKPLSLKGQEEVRIKKIFSETITHKIFESNSNFDVN